MILGGEFAPGSKIGEIAVATRLGVSRTPVRLALQVLEGEGLVTSAPNRGYSVRPITFHDVLSGFDVRGTLEGLACRLIAEAGLKQDDEQRLAESIAVGDMIVTVADFDEDAAAQWVEMNERFHLALVRAAGSAPLSAAHDLVCRNPLVGPKALAFSRAHLTDNLEDRIEDQKHHRAILDALRRGEGARAEWLAREHIHQARERTSHRLDNDAPLGIAGTKLPAPGSPKGRSTSSRIM